MRGGSRGWRRQRGQARARTVLRERVRAWRRRAGRQAGDQREEEAAFDVCCEMLATASGGIAALCACEPAKAVADEAEAVSSHRFFRALYDIVTNMC